MKSDTSDRAATETEKRILDAALELLGNNPDAGMGDIAVAAGVVRRTVYGYFPSRSDLLLALARRAVSEIVAVLTEVDNAHEAADVEWADFVAHLWPLVHRYRVLVVLRRGEYGQQIHAALGPVEKLLADLVDRGQLSGTFGRHLPADVLSQVAWSALFAIADDDRSRETIGVRSATMTSLLLLGVPEPRANELLKG